jgi:hypothetical protein
MSLLAEATALTTRKGGVCSVSLLEQTLDPATLAELREAMGSPVETSALARALTARGHDIKATALQRHRRGDCACPR